VSNQTNVSFAAYATEIGGWTFNAGASNYTFTNNKFLSFIGAGIGGSVSSAQPQTIINNVSLSFSQSSTAGNAFIVNNNVVSFKVASTAGNANILNNKDIVLLRHQHRRHRKH
jgi:hypothetical protein